MDPVELQIQGQSFSNDSFEPKHSVLEQIWIKGSYLDQRLPQHESLYPIELKSSTLGTFLQCKMSLNVIIEKKGFLY